MGLDISHDCWHGAYSAFSRWREEIAKVSGIPLELMEGFYRESCHELDKNCLDSALQWVAPREGGSLCGDYRGSTLYSYINRVHSNLPIKWTSLKPDVLHILLNHSDCDGIIKRKYLQKLANRLEELLPLLPTEKDLGHIGDWREKTQKFIDGCRSAYDAGEDIDFH